MLATTSDGRTVPDPVQNERGARWLGDLGRDLRHAARGLTRSPGFAASVALLLALGLGANTAMFGIVYGVLLRPLPYPDAGAIVRIGESLGSSGGSDMWLSNRSMPLLAESAGSFEELAGYQEISARSASLDGATLSGANVSPSLFPLLGSGPQLGRLFTEQDGRDGAEHVVLLSHGVWTTRFGSDADIVGTLVDLDGESHTVVGILPDGFDFPNPDNEFWTPLVVPPFAPPSADAAAEVRTVVRLVFGGLGRLRPGVSPEQAATEARTILQANAAGIMTRAGADQASGEGPEIDVRVVPLLEEMVGRYRPALLVLTAATTLVLLIACINAAGLLLARGVTRQRMFALCAALGAGRGRLVRQLLTESVALGLTGGVLGLAAAAAVLRVTPALVPVDVARLDEVGVDGVTVAFTVGLSVLVGLLSGAMPALQWSRLDLVRTLNEGSAQSAGGFRLLRSNRSRAVLARLEPLPDVEAFGLSRSLPFEEDRTSRTLFYVAGTPRPPSNEMVRTNVRIVSPGYIETMQLRLRDGRTIERLDGSGSPRVLVANETLARELFGGGPAVGRQVVSPFGEPWEVVGVVGGTSCTRASSSPRSPRPRRSFHWPRSAASGGSATAR